MKDRTMKVGSLLIGFFVLLVAGHVLAELPGHYAPLLDSPGAPDDWQTAIQNCTTTSANPTNLSSELKGLARDLHYDPALIYKMIHDYVEFEPSWGDRKGAYMTWMDRSGNAFDQATLMIALLQEAAQQNTELTITNPQYVVGEIQIEEDDAYELLWIPGEDPNFANQILACNGLYGTAVYDTWDYLESLNLEHVWVKVTINGVDYEFDPSFKSYTWDNGIDENSLANFMDYDKYDFMNTSLAGATDNLDSVKDVNTSNLRTELTRLSDELKGYLKQTRPDCGIADILGKQNIIPVADSNRPPSTVPYTVISRDETFASSAIPDIYRTTLRVQHQGIDVTLQSSDIYGKRLSLSYNASNEPELRLDGILQDTGNACTLGILYDITMTVDHPYYTNDMDSTTTLSLQAGGFYVLVSTWGDTGTKVLSHLRHQIKDNKRAGLTDTSETIMGDSYSLVGLTWQAQTSKLRDMGRYVIRSWTSGYSIVNHHTIAIAGQYTSPLLELAVSKTGIAYVDERIHYDPEPMFQTLCGHTHAYQGAILEYLQDTNSVSTARIFDLANDRSTYDLIFEVDSSDWSSKQNNLQGYSQDEKDAVSSYINDGYTVLLPQYGDNTQDNWTGTGFVARKATSTLLSTAHIMDTGFSGTCSTVSNDPISSTELIDQSLELHQHRGGYTTSATDISIGQGGYPYGLSFSRSYDSDQRHIDGPLGLGWTHNFNIVAKVRKNKFQYLTHTTPHEVIPQIVSLYVGFTLRTDVYKPSSRIISVLGEDWLMDYRSERVTIEQGESHLSFVKAEEGVYEAPYGLDIQLVTQSNGNFRIKKTDGTFQDFDSEGRFSQWSDAHGHTVDLTYDTSGKLTDVTSYIGGTIQNRSISFTYTGDRITAVSDSANRSVSYTYDSNGQLLTFTNCDNETLTYGYYGANELGLITEVYLPTQLEPFVTNYYDQYYRLQRQADVNDNPHDFYRADYRFETMGPEQLDPNDPNGPLKRYSSITWKDREGHTIRNIDVMGRETTYENNGNYYVYDRQNPSRISQQVRTQREQNRKLVELNKEPRPGFVDDSITGSKLYRYYINSEGRWFKSLGHTTDPSGNQTVNIYDYNDFTTYGTEVGNLMKVVYPDANTASGMEAREVSFDYDTYGRLTKEIGVDGLVTEYQYYGANDGGGLWKTIADANNLAITTETTYDSVGRVISVKDPVGNITQTQYTTGGKVTKIIDPNNDETHFDYYSNGRAWRTRRQTSQGTLIFSEVTYNALGQQASIRGPYILGTTDANEYNTNYTQYAYDSLGRTTHVTDAEGNISETVYLPDGKVWKSINAEGHVVVENTYNADGSLQSVKDAKGNITVYDYAAYMETAKVTYEDGTTVEPVYDNIRRISEVTKRNGEVVQNEYDENSWLTQKSIVDNPDETISFAYDKMGRVVTTTDKHGTTTNTYDALGRLIQVDYPDNRIVAYEYNILGQRTKLTYPDDTYITYEYDSLQRPWKIKNQSGTALATYTYDELSRRKKVVFANGTTTSYAYDNASRLTDVNNVTNNNQHQYSYQYDKVGNRLKMTMNGSEDHIYAYDKIFQVTDVNYPDSYSYLTPDTEFNYDPVGNRSSVVGDVNTPYTTNNLNQYTEVGDIYLAYDACGNLISDGVNFYEYDDLNRLTRVKKYKPDDYGEALDNCYSVYFWYENDDYSWDPCDTNAISGSTCIRTPAIEHDENSNKLCVKFTATQTATISFWWKVSSESGCDGLTYYLDGTWSGRITGEQDWAEVTRTVSAGDHEISWRYDKDSSVSDGNDCGWVDSLRISHSHPFVYSYRIETNFEQAFGYNNTAWPFTTGGDYEWDSDTDQTYDGDYSMESGDIEDDQTSWFQTTIDANQASTLSFYWKVSSEEYCDNLKFYIDGYLQDEISGDVDWTQQTYNLSAGSHTLKWEYEKDSSTSTGDDCGWVDKLEWDGFAMPRLTTDNWDTIEYAYDAAGRRISKTVDGTLYETYTYDGDHVLAEYDYHGNILRKYIYGPGVDQPICMTEVADSNAVYYYHTDGLGSIVALSNEDGNTVQEYDYTIYGQVAASDVNHPNPYMFTGRRFDVETGLYYYRARMYDAHLGRFLQTDPIGYEDGINWYAYCGNNPGNAVDPTGKASIGGVTPMPEYDDFVPDPRTIGSITVNDLIWQYLYGGGGTLTILSSEFANPFNGDMRQDIRTHFLGKAIEYYDKFVEEDIDSMDIPVQDSFSTHYGDKRSLLSACKTSGYFQFYLLNDVEFHYNGYVHCSRVWNDDGNQYDYAVSFYITTSIEDIADFHTFEGWQRAGRSARIRQRLLSFLGYLIADGVPEFIAELLTATRAKKYNIIIKNPTTDGYGPSLRTGTNGTRFINYYW